MHLRVLRVWFDLHSFLLHPLLLQSLNGTCMENTNCSTCKNATKSYLYKKHGWQQPVFFWKYGKMFTIFERKPT